MQVISINKFPFCWNSRHSVTVNLTEIKVFFFKNSFLLPRFQFLQPEVKLPSLSGAKNPLPKLSFFPHNTSLAVCIWTLHECLSLSSHYLSKFSDILQLAICNLWDSNGNLSITWDLIGSFLLQDLCTCGVWLYVFSQCLKSVLKDFTAELHFIANKL